MGVIVTIAPTVVTAARDLDQSGLPVALDETYSEIPARVAKKKVPLTMCASSHCTAPEPTPARIAATTETGSASIPSIMSQPGSGKADFLSEAVRRRLIRTARYANPCRVVPSKKILIPSISESCAAMTSSRTARVQRAETRVPFFSLASSVSASLGIMWKLLPMINIPTPP